jgi:hypothetical protein
MTLHYGWRHYPAIPDERERERESQPQNLVSETSEIDHKLIVMYNLR